MKYTGQKVLISGWGLQLEGTVVKRSLLYSELTIITKTECEADFGKFLLSSEICARGSDEKIPEASDIGGALILKDQNHTQYTQIGVLIRAKKGHPSIYLTVASYITWIENVTGDLFNNSV